MTQRPLPALAAGITGVALLAISACTPIDKDYFAERCAGYGLKANSEAYGQCLVREKAIVDETLRTSRPSGP